jgi:hypothetical protein
MRLDLPGGRCELPLEGLGAIYGLTFPVGIFRFSMNEALTKRLRLALAHHCVNFEPKPDPVLK